MSVNLLPWRERMAARRGRLLLSGVVVAALTMGVTASVCWQFLIQRKGEWQHNISNRKASVLRLQQAQQAINAGRSDNDMLTQIRLPENSEESGRGLGAAGLHWFSMAVAHDQLGLTVWQVSADAVDIRFQLHDRPRLASLLALMEEYGWQMAETHAEGEIIHVAISVPAVQ